MAMARVTTGVLSVFADRACNQDGSLSHNVDQAPEPDPPR